MLDELTNSANDPVWRCWRSWRKATTSLIYPDGLHAQAHRRRDVRLQIVADHPGVGRIARDSRQRIVEHALVRLPAPKFALDDDAVEEPFESEPVNAAPLGERAAVRDQRHSHAARLQPLERL